MFRRLLDELQGTRGDAHAAWRAMYDERNPLVAAQTTFALLRGASARAALAAGWRNRGTEVPQPATAGRSGLAVAHRTSWQNQDVGQRCTLVLDGAVRADRAWLPMLVEAAKLRPPYTTQTSHRLTWNLRHVRDPSDQRAVCDELWGHIARHPELGTSSAWRILVELLDAGYPLLEAAAAGPEVPWITTHAECPHVEGSASPEVQRAAVHPRADVRCLALLQLHAAGKLPDDPEHLLGDAPFDPDRPLLSMLACELLLRAPRVRIPEGWMDPMDASSHATRWTEAHTRLRDRSAPRGLRERNGLHRARGRVEDTVPDAVTTWILIHEKRDADRGTCPWSWMTLVGLEPDGAVRTFELPLDLPPLDWSEVENGRRAWIAVAVWGPDDREVVVGFTDVYGTHHRLGFDGASWNAWEVRPDGTLGRLPLGGAVEERALPPFPEKFPVRATWNEDPVMSLPPEEADAVLGGTADWAWSRGGWVIGQDLDETRIRWRG